MEKLNIEKERFRDEGHLSQMGWGSTEAAVLAG